jgi:dTDP-glucose 4,6-dehydratase
MPPERIPRPIKELLDARPVLVTGADGFVGSHLIDSLLGFGAHVHAFIRASSSGMLHNLSHVRTRIRIHRGELTDIRAVTGALRALQSDGGRPVIFHLGAQSHVGESWGRPFETASTNILGTLNLLQAVVDLGMDLHSLDTAGSSEEYGNIMEDVREHYRFDERGGLILDERSPVNPQSPYAAAKLAADFLTRSFYKAYGVPAIVTRMFNNYGPRQNPRFVTPAIITQALSGDCVRLGYVPAKRDFCYVKDGAMGHIHAALFGAPGEVYVYGNGRSISILDWYKTIIRIGQEGGFWGDKELLPESAGRGRLGRSEVEELRVDYQKLHNLTGWLPEYDWERGIHETIRWYAENRASWITRVDW